MSKIAEGIVRFHDEVYPEKKELFAKLANSQSPEALFITCSDSRIDPNLLVQTEPGQLFIIRNAGNMVPPHNNVTGGVTASIEYAVAALGVQHIIICGHSSCGAMDGVMHPEKTEGLPHVSNWLGFANAAHQIVEETAPDASPEEKLKMLTMQNVVLQLKHIQTHPQVAAKCAAGKLTLHGWFYDIGKGLVEAYDAEREVFVAVSEKYRAEAEAFFKSKGGGCCA